MRLKSLVLTVVDCSDHILNLFDEGDDSSWGKAISSFHEKWDAEGHPISLSKVLKEKRKLY